MFVHTVWSLCIVMYCVPILFVSKRVTDSITLIGDIKGLCQQGVPVAFLSQHEEGGTQYILRICVTMATINGEGKGTFHLELIQD